MLIATVSIIFQLVLSATADSTTTTELLWPHPTSMKFGSGVYIVDKDMSFFSMGPGSDSDILRGAFSRYQKLIFETPAPFYPSGGSEAANGTLTSMTVTVSSNDETLGLNTDESC